MRREASGAKVIKLEQELPVHPEHTESAANGVIRHNRGRKDKTLWTANGEGDLIRFKQFDTAREGSGLCGQEIRDSGYAYQGAGCALPHQCPVPSSGRAVYLLQRTLPSGGRREFPIREREIKDILACLLKTIANGVDDLSVLRIIKYCPLGNRRHHHGEGYHLCL